MSMGCQMFSCIASRHSIHLNMVCQAEKAFLIIAEFGSWFGKSWRLLHELKSCATKMETGLFGWLRSSVQFFPSFNFIWHSELNVISQHQIRTMCLVMGWTFHRAMDFWEANIIDANKGTIRCYTTISFSILNMLTCESCSIHRISIFKYASNY